MIPTSTSLEGRIADLERQVAALLAGNVLENASLALDDGTVVTTTEMAEAPAAAAEAVTASGAALAVASGKTTTYVGDDPPDPPDGGFAVNDEWLHTGASGTLLNYWDGAAWVPSVWRGEAIAADAINGKVITGAVVRTADPAVQVQRIELTSAAGFRAFNAAGTAVTTVNPATGLLTATGATISGEIRTADTGPRMRMVQTTAPAGSVEASAGVLELHSADGTPAYLRATTTTSGTTRTRAVTLATGSLPGSTSPGGQHYGPDVNMYASTAGGVASGRNLFINADEVGVSANLRGQTVYADNQLETGLVTGPAPVNKPGTIGASRQYYYNEWNVAADSSSSVMDMYADRFYVGGRADGTSVLGSNVELTTSKGMRSAWHAWNTIDNFGLNFITPDSGWTAGLNHWMIRGGWMWYTVRLSRASWAASTRICVLPRWPDADVDFTCTTDTGAAVKVRLRSSDGAVFPVNASPGSGGLSGFLMYPVHL